MIDYDEMTSPDQRKPISILLLSLIAAGVLLLLLAVSLNQTRLDEGYIIPFQQQEGGEVGGSIAVDDGDIWFVILRGLMALCIVALPIYVIRSLFSKKGRQELVALMIIIGVFYFVARVIENREEEEVVMTSEEGISLDSYNPLDMEFATVDGVPLPELPDEAPAWVNTVVLILGAVLVVGLVVAISLLIKRLRNKKEPDALDRVVDQAQQALHKIRSGGDFNSAILNCYYEMNRIVKEEMKLTRQQTMTARDFEAYLVNRGLPEQPIHQLTALFERARYGKQEPGATQEQVAIDSLSALIDSVHLLVPEEEGA